MKQRIVFANLLAPTLNQTYQHVMKYIQRECGLPAFLVSGATEHDFTTGAIDGGFLCGLAYVRLAQLQPCPVELVAAPILTGERYEQQPRYYSDVIVHRSSGLQRLQDLAGQTWAYNETASHSGYNLVYATLLERNYPSPEHYFGRLVETGSHARSLQMVLDRKADVAAIDSHMLDVIAHNNPEIMDQLCIIDTFGPSSIPPVVVSKLLPPVIKQQIKAALLDIHTDDQFTPQLLEGCIERFISVSDELYSDIRGIYQHVQGSMSL